MSSSATQHLDPRIGIFMREGRTVWYAFVDGYGKDPFEGTLPDVQRALGLRTDVAPDVSARARDDAASALYPNAQVRLSAGEPAQPKAPQKTKRGALRDYVVTVTPRVLTYGSHGCNGEYQLVVAERSHAGAIKFARNARNMEEGRYAARADYKARLKTEDDYFPDRYA